MNVDEIIEVWWLMKVVWYFQYVPLFISCTGGGLRSIWARYKVNIRRLKLFWELSTVY